MDRFTKSDYSLMWEVLADSIERRKILLANDKEKGHRTSEKIDTEVLKELEQLQAKCAQRLTSAGERQASSENA